MTDEELMKAIAKSDPLADKAAYELHEKYGSVVKKEAKKYFYSGSRHKDGDIAQDVSQEVWIKVVRKAASYSPRKGSSLAAWLRQITTLTCIDFDRKNHRDCRIEQGVEKVGKLPAPVQPANLKNESGGKPSPPSADRYMDVEAEVPDVMAEREDMLEIYKQHSPSCYRLIRAIAYSNLEPKDYKNFLNKSAGAARQFASYCRKLMESLINGDELIGTAT